MSIVYSIIIPTYNRYLSLDKCLVHIERMKKPQNHFEVMVMDNGSNEKTVKTVEKYVTRIPNLKYYSLKSPGLHVCRNFGYDKSKGKILCYLDDDSYVEQTWLQGIEEAFLNPDVVLAGGKILPEFEIDYPHWVNELWESNEYGKYISYYSILDFGDRNFFLPAKFVWGCNFSIRKKILGKCGGFHPDSLPDSLLHLRGDGESAVTRFIDKNNYRAYYSEKATVFHLVSARRLTFDYLYQRSYKQGISDSYSLVRKQKGSLIKSFINFYYWKSRSQLRKLILFFKPKNKSLQKVLYKGYWDGFHFHMKNIKQNPQLIDWILKENYFKERGTHLEQYEL